MYECSSCSNTYAWPQSLQRHFKNKHNAKDDETVFKDITSPKSSDNSDKEYMDLDESGDDLQRVNLEMIQQRVNLMTIQQRVNPEMMTIQERVRPLRMFGMI